LPETFFDFPLTGNPGGCIRFLVMNEITKDKAISLRIIFLMNEGKSLREAFDLVLGQGSFERLAGEVYDTLRAK
jgi:hypothetical protein